ALPAAAAGGRAQLPATAAVHAPAAGLHADPPAVVGPAQLCAARAAGERPAGTTTVQRPAVTTTVQRPAVTAAAHVRCAATVQRGAQLPTAGTATIQRPTRVEPAVRAAAHAGPPGTAGATPAAGHPQPPRLPGRA